MIPSVLLILSQWEKNSGYSNCKHAKANPCKNICIRRLQQFSQTEKYMMEECAECFKTNNILLNAVRVSGCLRLWFLPEGQVFVFSPWPEREHVRFLFTAEAQPRLELHLKMLLKPRWASWLAKWVLDRCKGQLPPRALDSHYTPQTSKAFPSFPEWDISSRLDFQMKLQRGSCLCKNTSHDSRVHCMGLLSSIRLNLYVWNSVHANVTGKCQQFCIFLLSNCQIVVWSQKALQTTVALDYNSGHLHAIQ